MKAKIEKAIEVLAGKISKDVGAIDALQYSQAALNLANAIRAIESK